MAHRICGLAAQWEFGVEDGHLTQWEATKVKVRHRLCTQECTRAGGWWVNEKVTGLDPDL